MTDPVTQEMWRMRRLRMHKAIDRALQRPIEEKSRVDVQVIVAVQDDDEPEESADVAASLEDEESEELA